MYRGRIAPSPTGYLHLGHARTFWIAYERARQHNGTLILRNEDLDASRAKPEFATAMLEDLRWFGLDWQEGPDVGGPVAPYTQSQRMDFYREAFQKLRAGNFIYPCTCSRHDVLRALQAPHVGEEEPIYPGTCRTKSEDRRIARDELASTDSTRTGQKISWRFHVPDGESIVFEDGYYGRQELIAGRDFGDFIVWRHDDIPAYQLAVVADDAAMQVTEVVRGADLLVSTARQILLYRALGCVTPKFYHCPLMHDETGKRLAKRHDALSLRELHRQGAKPEAIKSQPNFSLLPRGQSVH